jgi:alkanesulfonate monooxygenase SsuD/methylene tetrahydromethanopterin reductase-like flavin-dependent oxidoreductase (luciferase family)
VVVETDAVVNRGSLRESLRLRPEVLRRLGWHYVRVHSFELFGDPETVAARIAKLIGATVEVETVTAPIDIPVAG